jgi:predicted Rossmann fold nucleotide-binding protein DprA/Smf involved in DNA uptake
LIREGATLVTCLEEILEGLGPLPHGVVEPSLVIPAQGEAEPPRSATPQAADVHLSDEQRAILAQLDGEPIDVDLIIERTSLPAQIVLKELTFLALKGQVRRVGGQKYAKRS